MPVLPDDRGSNTYALSFKAASKAATVLSISAWEWAVDMKADSKAEGAR